MVNIRFGIPEHGWLPVVIDSGDFILELDVSDVPVNPLDGLCGALTRVLQGESAGMGWHLEPAWCWLRFQCHGRTIALTIFESATSNIKAEKKLRLISSVEELVLPWYQALLHFVAKDYGDDWPAIDAGRMEKLNKAILAWKNAQ